ncbi:signal peptide peptidase SppA [Peptococcaceae bacterium 1198_IL3148]
MSKRKIVTIAILGVVVISLIAAALGQNNGAKTTGAAEDSIALIDISGMIVSGTSGGSFTGDVMTGSQTVIEQLRQAKDDPNIKGVVLRINSPGGTPAGSLEIGNEIKRLRQSGKKVVAYMAETAASGAYWISCETDRIVANPTTMTGSIGVIMQTVDLQGLYDKVGVEQKVFKSGPHKDMGSEARDITPEEAAIFQGLIDDSYEQFLEVVANGRNMEMEKVRALADGRVYSGRQALKVGLVDQVGDLQQAIETTAKMVGIKGEPQVVNFGPKNFWDQLLGVKLMGLQYGPQLLPAVVAEQLAMPKL